MPGASKTWQRLARYHKYALGVNRALWYIGQALRVPPRRKKSSLE